MGTRYGARFHDDDDYYQRSTCEYARKQQEELSANLDTIWPPTTYLTGEQLRAIGRNTEQQGQLEQEGKEVPYGLRQ